MIRFYNHIPDFLFQIDSEMKYDKLIVLTDSNTFPLFSGLTTGIQSDQIIIIPEGEQHKNLTTAAMVWEQLALKKATRNSVLINFGGGVLCDLGGFVASTYMRGMRFVNIPTTLLCMVDASIGGKTGINLQGLKNYIGTFQPAYYVCISTPLLITLPREILVNGWAEVIKHGIISGNPLWNICNDGIADAKSMDWLSIVKLNLEVKSAVVEKDPNETELRKILNFGHTLGHALETAFLKNNSFISHGAAVAAGMQIESMIAAEQGMLSHSELEKIENCISKVFPKLNINAAWIPDLLEHIKADKKNESGKILLSLPSEIGDVKPNCAAGLSEIETALNRYAGVALQ